VGRVTYFTSGPADAFGQVLARLGVDSAGVSAVVWDGAMLREAG
jgi:hypothetical protein